jgi:hypothetical protein
MHVPGTRLTPRLADVPFNTVHYNARGATVYYHPLDGLTRTAEFSEYDIIGPFDAPCCVVSHQDGYKAGYDAGYKAGYQAGYAEYTAGYAGNQTE